MCVWVCVCVCVHNVAFCEDCVSVCMCENCVCVRACASVSGWVGVCVRVRVLGSCVYACVRTVCVLYMRVHL